MTTKDKIGTFKKVWVGTVPIFIIVIAASIVGWEMLPWMIMLTLIAVLFLILMVCKVVEEELLEMGEDIRAARSYVNDLRQERCQKIKERVQRTKLNYEEEEMLTHDVRPRRSELGEDIEEVRPKDIIKTESKEEEVRGARSVRNLDATRTINRKALDDIISISNREERGLSESNGDSN